jgi:predicted type IV restriction endonuclease
MNQERHISRIIVSVDLLNEFEDAVEKAGEHGTVEAYKALYRAALVMVHNYKEHQTHPRVFDRSFD